MRLSTAINLLILLTITITSTTPPISLALRCGTTFYPTLMQQLISTFPDTVFTTTNDFQVCLEMDLNGQTTNRISQIVAFQNIPDTAYGCQLNIVLPASGFVTYGFPILNVYALHGANFEQAINWPNGWSWGNLYPKLEGSNVFGEILVLPGESLVVNAEVCASDLAYLFEVASWVGVSSGVELQEAEGVGIFLSFDC